jgi:predicted TIM-barrel fold metal-dependent hydrolase
MRPHDHLRIDAHQHFWKFHPDHHTWMTADMEALRRDYLPDELKPLLKVIGYDGTIAHPRSVKYMEEPLKAISYQYQL